MRRTKRELTCYEEIILSATGCRLSEIAEIEEIMRDDIFHSTLDWQTRAELVRAARLAYAVLHEMRRGSVSENGIS